MRKIFKISIICLLITLNSQILSKASADRDYNVKMKQDFLILMLSYPEDVVGLDKKNDDKIYLIMKSGKKIIYDDNKQKAMKRS